MAFPNAAQNLAEQHLSLSDLVSLSHHSSLLVRSDTNYLEAGIMLGFSSCHEWRAYTSAQVHYRGRGG